MKVKICGIRTVDDVAACSGSDYIGLMFYKNSKRFINIKQTVDLYHQLNHRSIDIPQSVAVVVNPTIQDLDALFSEDLIRKNIKIIQFHGQETGIFCEEIAKRYNLKYWKALAFTYWTKIEMQQLLLEYPHAEYFLIDSAKKQQDNTTFGGTGHAFDWYSQQTIQTLQQLSQQKPMIVAGGINTDNIEQAVLHFSNIHANVIGFDLSSGVESFNEASNNQSVCNDFYKDEKKIKHILKICQH